MCHKCEALKNNLHLQFIKTRGDDANANPFERLGDSAYPMVMQAAEVHAVKLLERAQKGSDELKAEVAMFGMSVEKKALDYAESVLSRENLEQAVKLANTLETLTAALALIQAKAVLTGNDEIGSIARSALDDYSTKLFKFGQSSKELQDLLDNNQ